MPNTARVSPRWQTSGSTAAARISRPDLSTYTAMAAAAEVSRVWTLSLIHIYLGIDRIIPYDPDDIQGLRPSATDPIALPAKSGPRHMEFTRDERWLYVVCELANTVLVYELFDKTPQLRQKLSTLPDGYEGENLAADLHLSSDEKHLYVSNRGHDSLAHFTVGEDHRLRLACLLYTSSCFLLQEPKQRQACPRGLTMLVRGIYSGKSPWLL